MYYANLYLVELLLFIYEYILLFMNDIIEIGSAKSKTIKIGQLNLKRVNVPEGAIAHYVVLIASANETCKKV